MEQNPNFLVPVDVHHSNPSPPPPTGQSSAQKSHQKSGRKARAQQGAALSMDDYFKEGEAKSQELEGRQSSQSNSGSIPPPPKAAGSGAGDISTATQPNADGSQDAA